MDETTMTMSMNQILNPDTVLNIRKLLFDSERGASEAIRSRNFELLDILQSLIHSESGIKIFISPDNSGLVEHSTFVKLKTLAAKNPDLLGDLKALKLGKVLGTVVSGKRVETPITYKYLEKLVETCQKYLKKEKEKQLKTLAVKGATLQESNRGNYSGYVFKLNIDSEKIEKDLEQDKKVENMRIASFSGLEADIYFTPIHWFAFEIHPTNFNSADINKIKEWFKDYLDKFSSDKLSPITGKNREQEEEKILTHFAWIYNDYLNILGFEGQKENLLKFLKEIYEKEGKKSELFLYPDRPEIKELEKQRNKKFRPLETLFCLEQQGSLEIKQLILNNHVFPSLKVNLLNTEIFDNKNESISLSEVSQKFLKFYFDSEKLWTDEDSKPIVMEFRSEKSLPLNILKFLIIDKEQKQCTLTEIANAVIELIANREGKPLHILRQEISAINRGFIKQFKLPDDRSKYLIVRKGNPNTYQINQFCKIKVVAKSE